MSQAISNNFAVHQTQSNSNNFLRFKRGCHGARGDDLLAGYANTYVTNSTILEYGNYNTFPLHHNENIWLYSIVLSINYFLLLKKDLEKGSVLPVQQTGKTHSLNIYLIWLKIVRLLCLTLYFYIIHLFRPHMNGTVSASFLLETFELLSLFSNALMLEAFEMLLES